MLNLMLPFAVGAFFGALMGGQVYQSLQLDRLPAIIGAFILVITWIPLPGVRGGGNWTLALLGFYQTGLGMLIGATGPLGAAVLARRNLQRDWLVVNTSVYMSCSHLLKILAFGIMGFAFADYLWLMLGMILGVIAGSWVGTWLRQFIPEGNFQFWFKLMISLLAVRMIVVTVMGE